ncbi:MAG TPA: GNAT family N-acetyltransferase [Blastocatellia bacterium]|nr:GNAT family N-acetyltransferase [Blastocatellia bacterium]
MQNDLTLRPVTSDDEDFLIGVYAGTRAEEVAGLPWDANQRDSFMRMQFAAQQQDYQRRFPDSDHRLLLLDGRRAGRVYLARGENEIRILDIALVPEHRNKGIGTRIIKDLLTESSQSRKPVRVYVEQFNPALALFERLGFSRAEDIGTHFLLEWRARL